MIPTKIFTALIHKKQRQSFGSGSGKSPIFVRIFSIFSLHMFYNSALSYHPWGGGELASGCSHGFQKGAK